MTRHALTRLTAIALAASGLVIAGCSQADRDEAKAKSDQAVATMKEKGAELKADAKQAGAEIKADAKEATADAKDKTADLRADASQALDKAKVSVSDATITTSVKAELAKDPVLKARDINVDTSGGTVSLRGTAPSAEAKSRATTLASAVSGVVNVKNELTVAANS